MKKLLILGTLILSALNAFNQIIFDLADKKTTTETIDLSVTSTILFKSLTFDGVSKNQYLFTVEMEESVTPPFSLKGLDKAGYLPCDKTNPDLDKAIKKFKNELDETKISFEINELDIQKKKLDANNSQCRKEIEALIELTKFSKPLQFGLRNNQIITVRARRKYIYNEIDTVVTWVKVFKTPEKSPWKIMYGFTFVPNQLNKVNNFYTKATDATNQSYTITKLNNNSQTYWENISPTIMFQWTPLSSKKDNANNQLKLGFVGGLSLNFAKETGNVSVMAGPSLILAENLSFSTGLIFTQKNVLLGQYKEGDVVKEKFDFSQLHVKKYMPEIFISIAFRFDQNPFGGKTETKKE